MPALEPWADWENVATIRAYVDLLHAELRGERPNKSAIERELVLRLDGRTRGAVSKKFQNISAILNAMHFRWIDGYKPLGNYQWSLAATITQTVLDNPSIVVAAQNEADEVPSLALPENILSQQEAPPLRDRLKVFPDQARSPGSNIRQPMSLPDIYGREAANTLLGRQGEGFALAFERSRLASLGLDSLISRIEHVSESVGDGLGFDIHSYEQDGSDRFIEVKTTKYAKPTPFYLSSNEVAVSRLKGPRYHLYRLFDFGKRTRLYTLEGALDVTCDLEASVFRARPI